MSGTRAAHGQASYAVRCDWGPTGAAAITGGVDVAVVVDVLSFTTAVTVAVEGGAAVLPYPWRDGDAAAYAADRGATLAMGRVEARAAREAGHQHPVSLSPADMARASANRGLGAVVLPSPNGSSICFALADTGVEVVAACLRNRSAVARWLTSSVERRRVAIVAAGERWPDGSLRPAVEDLWGAGAVLDALGAEALDGASPEARLAASSFREVRADLTAELATCASGVELIGGGFAEDVSLASELDVSEVVPVLRDGGFRDLGDSR